MKTIVFFLFLSIGATVFSQHKGKGECAMKPGNTDWLWDFKDASQKDQKLMLIVNKITEDSQFLGGLAEDDENAADKRVFGSSSCTDTCAMRFVLIYGNSRGLVLDLAKHPQLEEVLAEFTPENISKIELNEKHERNIYGVASKQRSGIILHTEDKQLRKKVRRTLREIEKAEDKAE